MSAISGSNQHLGIREDNFVGVLYTAETPRHFINDFLLASLFVDLCGFTLNGFGSAQFNRLKKLL